MASCGTSKERDEIEELGLEDMVTLHGFVPAEDLEAALASAQAHQSPISHHGGLGKPTASLGSHSQAW
jgi:glycosyltransferase involved in cell wall biosynthesis